MKKYFFALAICITTLTSVDAQVSFSPGIRAGLNFSHFTKGDTYSYYNGTEYVEGRDEFSARTDFYLGFFGALKLSKFYTLQPEIDYSRQGTKYSYLDNNSIERKSNIEVSYLSIAVVNKFTFSDKFNMHIGPTIDFVVDDNFNPYNEVDLTFLLGFGYNFNSNFGIEGRIKKGIIPVLDTYNGDYYNDSNHTNVVFSIGATYTFDLK